MAGKFSFSNIFGSISKIIEDEATADTKKSKSARYQANDGEIQNAILVLAAEVIRRDKNYTTETERFIRDFYIEQFGGAGLAQRISIINSRLDTGTEPYIQIACKELKMLTTHDSRITIIRFLFGVAAADDFVNPKETRCIHRLAGYLGISEKDFKEIRQHFLRDHNPYTTLGVDENATDAQVHLAYRKMVLKFHPDKRGKEISEEEANYKFREIQRAFETLKKQRINK